MNQVYLSGIIKDDVWIRKNDTGMLVASFEVLEERGDSITAPAIRCITYGGLADKAGLTVRKGKHIELSGTLSFYSRLTKEGKKSYFYTVQVDYLQVEKGDVS